MATLLKEIIERANIRVSIVDQLVRLTSNDDWDHIFFSYKANARGMCVVRINVGSNTFFSDVMPVSDVDYEHLEYIIKRFNMGDNNTFDENIFITFITFEVM